MHAGLLTSCSWVCWIEARNLRDFCRSMMSCPFFSSSIPICSTSRFSAVPTSLFVWICCFNLWVCWSCLHTLFCLLNEKNYFPKTHLQSLNVTNPETIPTLHSKHRFLRVDFLVVCSSWLELFAQALPISPTFLRLLRLGKLLRALRVVRMSQVLEPWTLTTWRFSGWVTIKKAW